MQGLALNLDQNGYVIQMPIPNIRLQIRCMWNCCCPSPPSTKCGWVGHLLAPILHSWCTFSGGRTLHKFICISVEAACCTTATATCFSFIVYRTADKSTWGTRMDFELNIASRILFQIVLYIAENAVRSCVTLSEFRREHYSASICWILKTLPKLWSKSAMNTLAQTQ